MARTIVQIHQEIKDKLVSEASAVGVIIDPAQWTRFNMLRLITYVTAFCFWTLEKLFDAHKQEVADIIATQKPHTLQWYAEKAKAFQYGYNLVPDQDYYDNTTLTDEQIETSKVIRYAAVEEVAKGLRVKVAAIDAGTGDLAPVPGPQFTAFMAYMERIKDAGVHLANYYVNETADSLKLTVLIKFNPLVLNSSGQRLDGTNDTPVQDAIDQYLEEGMTFNSLFVPSALMDYIQAVEGVERLHFSLVQARYGVLPYSQVTTEYLPFSGYLRIVNPGDLTLTFSPA